MGRSLAPRASCYRTARYWSALPAVLVTLGGCGPGTLDRGAEAPRPGTADDVVQAALAETPRAALLLPVQAARAEADLAPGLASTPDDGARPPTPHPTSLCESIGDPVLDEVVARFVQDPPGGSAGSWRLLLAGPLVGPSRGPAATAPGPRVSKPVRLVVQSTARPDRVDVAIEAGGWLLCALPSLQLLVDGIPLPQLYAKRASPGSTSLDLGVRVTGRGAHLSFELSTAMLRTVASATRFEIAWKGGRIVLYPQRQDAVRAMASYLEPGNPVLALPIPGASVEPVGR